MHLLKRFISKEAKNEISLFLDDIIKVCGRIADHHRAFLFVPFVGAS